MLTSGVAQPGGVSVSGNVPEAPRPETLGQLGAVIAGPQQSGVKGSQAGPGAPSAFPLLRYSSWRLLGLSSARSLGLFLGYTGVYREQGGSY